MTNLQNTYSNTWTHKKIIQYTDISSALNWKDVLLFGLPNNHIVLGVKLTTLVNFTGLSGQSVACYVANPNVLLEATAPADAIPFPFPGKIAPTTALTMTSSGQVEGYFYSRTSTYMGVGGASNIDLVRINNVTQSTTGAWFFNNQTTTPATSATMIYGNAGDVLEVQIQNTTLNQIFSSIPANSPDGINHAYFAPFSSTGPWAIAGIPDGVYVGTEDLTRTSSDLNYADDNFVITNVTITNDITNLITNPQDCYGMHVVTVPSGSGDSYEYGSFRWFSLSAPGGATYIRNQLPGNPTVGSYCLPQRFDPHDVTARFILMDGSNSVAKPVVEPSLALSSLTGGVLEVAVQYVAI